MASWTYQVVNPPASPADGTAFVVQNDARGAAALGSAGGALGYGTGTLSAITNSVALEFNIYSPNGVGYSFDTNGAIGPYLSALPVSIASGDLIEVTLTYLNGEANLYLEDSNTMQTFSTSIAANVPELVGGNTAYVGFTGSDGGSSSQQQVSNFEFISLIDLSAARSGANVVLSWPAGVGGYVPQQNSSLTSTNWTPVNATITTSGGLNQVTVPASSGPQFFRLALP
jgi:hypothetical protein